MHTVSSLRTPRAENLPLPAAPGLPANGPCRGSGCLCLKCLSQDSHNLEPGRPVPLPSELGWVLLSAEISSDLFPATLKMTERDRMAEPMIPTTGPAPGTFPLLIMPWGK